MHTGHALLITLLSLGISHSAWSSADTGHANSNANSREVASALGGLKNKTYELEQAPKIRVASFNITAGKVSDMTAIAKAIRAMNVDVVALQEVDKLTARSGRGRSGGGTGEADRHAGGVRPGDRFRRR